MENVKDAKKLWKIINAAHQNKWVAIAPDYSRTLAVADTISELVRTVGERDAIFHRVLPENVSFAPATAERHEV